MRACVTLEGQESFFGDFPRDLGNLGLWEGYSRQLSLSGWKEEEGGSRWDTEWNVGSERKDLSIYRDNEEKREQEAERRDCGTGDIYRRALRLLFRPSVEYAMRTRGLGGL